MGASSAFCLCLSMMAVTGSAGPVRRISNHPGLAQVQVLSDGNVASQTPPQVRQQEPAKPLSSTVRSVVVDASDGSVSEVAAALPSQAESTVLRAELIPEAAHEKSFLLTGAPKSKIPKDSVHKAPPAEELAKVEESTSLATTSDPAAKDVTGIYTETKLVSQGDGAFYLSKICLGNEQCFMGILDTGSFELVVRGKGCAFAVPPCDCTHHGCFDSGNSSEFSAKPGPPVPLTYGSGTVVTLAGFDVVTIGKNVVHHQYILQTNWVGIEGLRDGTIHAIWGIGRGSEKYRDARLLAKMKIGTYSVCLLTDPKLDGLFIWADPAPTYSQLAPNGGRYWAIPIFGQVHWAAPLSNMTLVYKNTSTLPLACEGGCGAILDSGTTFIAPPQEVVDHLKRYINQRKIDCNDYKSLPNLDFVMGDHTYSLPPAAYVARATNVPEFLHARLHIPVVASREAKDETCMFLFISPLGVQTNKGPAMIMGMPFFRYYKMLFDWKNSKAYAARHSTKDCTLVDDTVENRAEFVEPMRLDLKDLTKRQLGDTLDLSTI